MISSINPSSSLYFGFQLVFFFNFLLSHFNLKTSLFSGLILFFSTIGDYDMALDYFGRALAIEEELGDKRGVEMILYNFGNVLSGIIKSSVKIYTQGINCKGTMPKNSMEYKT